MICPRCGRSTPGNVCPYCDGPQIEDYTDDYIKRKKEYESISGKSDDAVKDTTQETEKKQVSFRKFIIPVVIAAAAAVAAVIAINIIKDYRPAPEYSGNAVYFSDGKIYRLTGTDAEEIGDARTLFLNGDGSKIYKSDAVLNLLSKDSVRTDKTMTDDQGGYFACSVYDSSVESDNYKLYVWSGDNEPVEKLSSNGMIGIKYISDTGRIFFTKTDVITDELGTGETSLWYFDISDGSTGKLEENVYSVNFYSKTGAVMIIDKEDILFLRKVDDPSYRMRIADGVSDLLPEKNGNNNFFRITDDTVNNDGSADRFCYGKDNRIYMYDISSDGQFVDMAGAVSSDVSVSYDDVNRIVYAADAKSLTGAFVENGSIIDRKKLDADITGGNTLWNDHKKTLLFLSSDGTLKKIVNGRVSNVSDTEGIQRLTGVENDGGYAYVKDGTFYYGSDLDKEPVSLGEVSSENISSVVKADGYVYRLEGRQLIAAKDDGTYTKNMGECESLWCGEL